MGLTQPSQNEIYADQRRVPRKKYDGYVSILHAARADLARGLELGEGGMMIESAMDLQVDDLIVVTFSVFKRDFLSIRAKVLYVTKQEVAKNQFAYRCGVEFQNVQFAVKRTIRGFVSAQSNLEG